MLFVPLLISLVVTTTQCERYVERTTSERLGLSRTEPALYGLMFTDNLLYTTSATTKTICSLKCVDQIGCVAFTFDEVIVTCQGHATVPTTATSSYSSSDAVTFTFLSEIPLGGDCTDNPAMCVTGTECDSDVCKLSLGEDCSGDPTMCVTGAECDSGANVCMLSVGSDCSVNPNLCVSTAHCIQNACKTIWLNMACSTNAECGETNSRCFKSTCLCEPGYYYSNSADTCLASCSTANQQDTYLRYPRSAIHGGQVDDRYGMDVASCKSLCNARANNACRSVEFHPSNGRCQILEMTPLTGTYDEGYGSADFYQRTCV